jgi:predicted PhzF superfamily epimerase YddE/YHI9
MSLGTAVAVLYVPEMPLELQVVDAFTDRPFAGNPAAVAVLDAFPPDERMQAIAREMNLPETAFTVARPDDTFDLRWFTPTVEVDFCGHATVATAHVLGGAAQFHTRVGTLTCTTNAAGWIEMDAPADPPTELPYTGEVSLPGLSWYGQGRYDAVAVLASAASVRTLVPDLAAVAALGTRALVVTAPGDRPGIDCVSRVFGPNTGVAEDPVTGSAHCMLACLWGDRLGRSELVGEQASARGGTVRMRRAGDRVVIGGQAVTVSEIRLLC